MQAALIVLVVMVELIALVAVKDLKLSVEAALAGMALAVMVALTAVEPALIYSVYGSHA